MTSVINGIFLRRVIGNGNERVYYTEYYRNP
jgi:hypothetical protein